MTRLLLELTVEGEPRAKGRPRFANGHAFTPPATRAAEGAFKWEARAKHQGKPFTGPLRVDTTFYMSTKRRVDIDNLQKLVWDAMLGVVFADDSQIAEGEARRALDRGRPRTVVRVYALDAPPAGA